MADLEAQAQKRLRLERLRTLGEAVELQMMARSSMTGAEQQQLPRRRHARLWSCSKAARLPSARVAALGATGPSSPGVSMNTKMAISSVVTAIMRFLGRISILDQWPAL